MSTMDQMVEAGARAVLARYGVPMSQQKPADPSKQPINVSGTTPWMDAEAAICAALPILRAEIDRIIGAEGPASQDMTSTFICAALDRAADKVRSRLSEIMEGK